MPIMWGLAIGAAMGGGIAALQGKKMDDVLKGAVIGGATGALGGGISSLMPAATGVTGAATVAEGATSTALADGVTASAFPVTNAPSGAPLGEIFNQPGVSNALTPNSIDFNSAGDSFIPGPDGSGADSSVNMMQGLRTPNLSSTSNVAPTTSDGLGIRPPAGFMSQTPKPDGFFDSGIGKTIADNKGMLGMGALGLMALKPQGSGGAPEQTGYIRPYTYNAKNQTYAAQAPVKASDFGTRSVANGGIIGMAEGGDVTTEEQRANKTNPTLEALAAIQQTQQTYQPPAVSQGITQPLIQPQMAAIQQQYAAPQRQVPDAFQYQAPSFVKYSNTGGGGGAGGGSDNAINPTTKQPVKSAAPIIAAKKPATDDSGGSSDVFDTYGNEMGPKDIYSGPGYYERYPVAEVYDYTNDLPTRPFNPNEGSPEFNVPSNVPVDPSSGLSAIQQQYANQGYTDYIPTATNTDMGAANGGLMRSYAMGGGIGGYYPEPDDGDRQLGVAGLNQGPQYPMQGIGYAMGGHLGGYSDGGQLLKGPGDGVSDDIPAQIGTKQPARLADGEFVIPARIVSELGNGSTDAGAKRLYAMMDRIQKNRGKTVGKGKVAVNSRSDKYLPA